MISVEAMLCDAATVREGLLNVLGAGITQLNREQFPAPMGVQLALLLNASQDEMSKNHRMKLALLHQAGDKVAELAVDFAVGANPGTQKAQPITVPIIASFQQQNLPKEGGYVIELSIDDKLAKKLEFYAAKVQTQPTVAAAGRGFPAQQHPGH